MNRNRRRRFLESLFQQYVEPRAACVLSARWHPRLTHEWCYQQGRLLKAARLLRFVYEEADRNDEIFETFQPKALQRAGESVRHGISVARQMADRSGILDCLDSHYYQIVEELCAEDFPEAEIALLRASGSRNPRKELEAIVHTLKTVELQKRGWSEQELIRTRLKAVEQKVEKEVHDLEELGENEKPKPRRWFKGLGQIGQGAAMTIGDIALAVGVLTFPVSPETQSWGALVSATGGIGMIVTGVGELRGE